MVNYGYLPQVTMVNSNLTPSNLPPGAAYMNSRWEIRTKSTMPSFRDRALVAIETTGGD